MATRPISHTFRRAIAFEVTAPVLVGGRPSSAKAILRPVIVSLLAEGDPAGQQDGDPLIEHVAYTREAPFEAVWAAKMPSDARDVSRDDGHRCEPRS